MRKLIIVFLFFISHSLYAQESLPKDDVKNLELGFTPMVANLAFPAFDFSVSYLFFRKGINSLSFSSTLFIYINGNAFYKPMFTLVSGLWQLQYRVTTQQGFVFAMETGLGVSGEFASSQVFSVEKGFHKDLGTTYGMFSAALKFGYDFYEKYKKSWILDFMVGYRMLFPYNMKFSNLILLGIGLSYSFDLSKK